MATLNCLIRFEPKPKPKQSLTHAFEMSGGDRSLNVTQLSYKLLNIYALVLFDMMKVAAILWVIWFSWNEAVWGNIIPSLSSMQSHVDATCLLWMQAYGQAGGSRTGSNPPVWSPPPAGYLKCNVDAAIFTNGAGVGVVVRNEEGKFVAAYGAKLNCFNDPFMAETMAVKEALKWLKINHFNNVILETDCLNFCSAFNSVALNRSYVGLIVRQCRVLASDIGNFCVRHVNRSVNHLAHVLPRATDSMSGLGSRFTVPPTCISSLIDA
ncbi:PREDICTED: uncharacterized protein LOC109147828 [Ipomoea nil]|uniref:uncharacterized protein LOC109147828 n=1 Tax=Ipomoea nil TaxID=35883 RepID=UPI0009010AFC|nr:PREDICTED: uncharacterized protein LOC109147828 [Ipomoea nil]